VQNRSAIIVPNRSLPNRSLPKRAARAAVAAAVLAAAVPSPAAAQDTQYLFTGTFIVTAASKSCRNMVGDSRTMYYSTGLWGITAPDGTPKPGFVLVNPNGTVVITPKTKGFNASGDYDLTQVDRWNGLSTWSSKYNSLAFSPAKIRASTTELTITGKLRKFNFDDTCTVTFRAVGLRAK